MLGLGIALGDGVSVGLLAAIFVSNLPEAVGSASAMRKSAKPNRDTMRLWTGVAARAWSPVSRASPWRTMSREPL